MAATDTKFFNQCLVWRAHDVSGQMFSLKKHFNLIFIVALFAKEWIASGTVAFVIPIHSLFHGYKSCEIEEELWSLYVSLYQRNRGKGYIIVTRLKKCTIS